MVFAHVGVPLRPPLLPSPSFTQLSVHSLRISSPSKPSARSGHGGCPPPPRDAASMSARVRRMTQGVTHCQEPGGEGVGRGSRPLSILRPSLLPSTLPPSPLDRPLSTNFTLLPPSIPSSPFSPAVELSSLLLCPPVSLRHCSASCSAAFACCCCVASPRQSLGRPAAKAFIVRCFTARLLK